MHLRVRKVPRNKNKKEENHKVREEENDNTDTEENNAIAIIGTEEGIYTTGTGENVIASVLGTEGEFDNIETEENNAIAIIGTEQGMYTTGTGENVIASVSGKEGGINNTETEINNLHTTENEVEITKAEESPEKKNHVTKKERLPYASTSERWLQYHENKEKLKIQKEKEKQERALMRKRKKDEKQQKVINKKIPKKIVKQKNKKSKHEFSESESEEWSESGSSLDDVSEEHFTSDSDNEPLVKIAKPEKKIKKGDFYLVSFPGKKKAHNYVCTILNVLNKNEMEVQALCPVDAEKLTYRFIDGDISIISNNQLLHKLEQPKLSGTENRIKHKFSLPILAPDKSISAADLATDVFTTKSQTIRRKRKEPAEKVAPNDEVQSMPLTSIVSEEPSTSTESEKPLTQMPSKKSNKKPRLRRRKSDSESSECSVAISYRKSGSSPMSEFDVFSEWKSKVRRKARIIEQSRIQTGGGPADSTELNAVEEQLLALTSKIYLGDTEVEEAGVSASRPG
ncbi:unnamed protein product [Brassicogethes aeneus]|uniref:Uncharacterized protein n=1 Tax=Brassicogethes aeneus TaxID=1431903 RepID=A0A9P0BGS5_BRAAE|nr:unnamed protein product [Brassicogethes aeneus]